MQAHITQKGIIIPKDILIKNIGVKKYMETLKDLTIVKTKRLGNQYTTREEKLYKTMRIKGREFLILARFATDQIPISLNYLIKIPDGDIIPQERLGDGPTLDSNQQIVANHLDLHYQNNVDKGLASTVLVMNTGCGKTYVGVHRIGVIGLKTLVIVPSETVMKEWIDAITNCFPNIKLGYYYAKRKIDGDVVLMVINSAINYDFTFIIGRGKDKITTTYKYYEYFTKFGFVIYDEIHNYTSTVRQTVLWRTNFKYGLGLTATPDEESWGMDIIYQKHVGQLMIASDLPDYNPQLTKWSGIVRPIWYIGPPEYTVKIINSSTNYTSHGDMVKQFCSDPYRNKLIIQIVKELYLRGRNMFIFFKNRDYAQKLIEPIKSQIIGQNAQINETPDATILMGGATDEDRHKSSSARIVLTTYSYGWQGISIPKMDTLVFATPRKAKMRQIFGRILRKSGDPSIPREIIDIIDANTQMGKSEYNERKLVYKETKLYQFEIQKKEHYEYSQISNL